MQHLPPCGKLSPFAAVTRILSIPLLGTGGLTASSGWGLPGVGVVEREVSEGLLLLELWCLPDRNPPSLNSVRRIINADDKRKHDDERTNKGLVSNDFPKTSRQKTIVLELGAEMHSLLPNFQDIMEGNGLLELWAGI